MSETDRVFWWVGGGVLLFVLFINFLAPSLMKVNYAAPLGEERFASATVNPQDFITHLPTPESVKALYMTSCVASTPSWRTHLKNFIETTELNSVVIDIKDYTGTIAFAPKNYGRGCVVSDLKEFIQELHSSNIYVIGRISVFQDLYYANLYPDLAVKNKSDGGVWKDHKGISFIDVGARPYWDYIVDISKQAYELGFDELNYDYVRYPSDGNMQNAHYSWTAGTSTKSEMLESFFSYLYEKTQEIGAKTSVDIFGMTTSTKHDLGIGQVLERVLPYFDYVSPMVYPSHYPSGWNGFENPAANPYEVIKKSMGDGLRREEAMRISQGVATSTPSKLRPWLQDFSLGATYDAEKVRAQIQASEELGLTSWMMWSAANKYTEDAYLSE